MSLTLLRAGILTTVQDLGRSGWRRCGINPNGPMDPVAARVANLLAGNDENNALLEMHFPAAEIRFDSAVTFAICGGDFSAELDREPVGNWRSFLATKGSTLHFTGKMTGERSYLAVRGGLDIPLWLGSASTNLNARVGGLDGRKLQAGERIGLRNAEAQHSPVRAVSPYLLPHYSRFPTVRIVPGPEYEYLSKSSRKALTSQNFTISPRSNRMGFQLDGEPLSLGEPRELISSAVTFGTIQLLPDGQLIVLMADQQTAGGYPRIAHVISYDLPLVGQLGAGDKVAFHMVEYTDAERLMLHLEEELSLLRVACRFQSR
ncbi:MAG TPA: biotin-dependent carboxyltransferase family protein [Pyrinomonadaceae bacterium]|jgi:antagonist of KipI|nr:biotin-dependent carboxyltransferase family protein [Pyrinomonadaceae bacterium]